MCRVLTGNVRSANIPSMVVTMGGQGAVYACADGDCGIVTRKKVDVMDTTGAGDAFFAGTVIGLTYGKRRAESCEIGSQILPLRSSAWSSPPAVQAGDRWWKRFLSPLSGCGTSIRSLRLAAGRCPNNSSYFPPLDRCTLDFKAKNYLYFANRENFPG